MSFVSTFAAISAVIIVFAGGNTFYSTRTPLSQEHLDRIQQTEYFLDSVIYVSPERSRWENTVASYRGVPDLYWLSAPSGVGWNLYSSDAMISVNEKYVLLPHIFYHLLEYYLSEGYEIIDTSPHIYVLVNPRFQP